MAKKLRLILILSIILLSILGFVFPNPHPHFWWQQIPVFDVAFGFFGCVVIILVSKWIGHRWLMKDEGYYD
jgi:membrane protease YdiL (CAAX protease family)